MKFNEKLTQLRQAKKISRKEMAKLLEMNEIAYGCYERGERMPNIDKICKLADFFEISIDELLCRNVKLQRAKEKWQSIGYTIQPTSNDCFELQAPLTYEQELNNVHFDRGGLLTIKPNIRYVNANNLITATEYAEKIFNKKTFKSRKEIYGEIANKLPNYDINEIPF